MRIVAIGLWVFLCFPASSFISSSCFQGNLDPNIKSEEIDGSCHLKDERNFHGMVLVNGGTYQIGTDEPVFVADGESPARLVHLDSYYIDAQEVSNQAFHDFIKLSNYVTEAEKFGSSFVFEGILSEKVKSEISQVVAAAPWWMPVPNASWQYPEGPSSSIKGRLNFLSYFHFIFRGKFDLSC